MTRNIFALVILMNIVAGCSNEQVFSAVKYNRQLECQQLPQGQYEECMKKYDQSYDAYSRDRDDALKDKK